MEIELIKALEERIELLLESYSAMKKENSRLAEENVKLLLDRETVKSRLDNLLSKLEGV